MTFMDNTPPPLRSFPGGQSGDSGQHKTITLQQEMLRSDGECVQTVLLSSALHHKTQYLTVEVVGCEELFECQMHAVAPVVEWVGGYVDAL